MQMRTDLFQDRKGVHVKLTKEVHAKFRARLFMHNLSMQQALEEFATLVANESPKANRILERLVMRHIQDAIDGLKRIPRGAEAVSELDHDALYRLINGDEDEQVEVP